VSFEIQNVTGGHYTIRVRIIATIVLIIPPYYPCSAFDDTSVLLLLNVSPSIRHDLVLRRNSPPGNPHHSGFLWTNHCYRIPTASL